MSEAGDNERVSLAPSSWNYWRPFYTGHAWRAGCLLLPVILVGALVQSEWIMGAGIVFSGVAWLLAMRSQRNAFFTPTRIHWRRGLLGLTAQDVPIHAVDQVLVDPVRWVPGAGHLTVQAGSTYMQFECVPEAEARARTILELAQAARDRRAKSA